MGPVPALAAKGNVAVAAERATAPARPEPMAEVLFPLRGVAVMRMEVPRGDVAGREDHLEGIGGLGGQEDVWGRQEAPEGIVKAK